MKLLFETDRLRARQLGPDDLDAMLAVYGDVPAMRWVADGRGLDREGCARWIAKTLDNYATRGYGMTALVDKASGEVVGFCGIVHPPGQDVGELKYALRRSHWGRGLATEAAAGMLACARNRLGMTEVIATCDPENLASHRVLEKAGMAETWLRPNDDGSTTRMFRWRAAPG